MKNNQYAALVLVAMIGGSIIGCLESRKEEQAKRDLIEAQHRDNMQNMILAAEQVERDIKEGVYNGRTIGDVITDFEFYQIALRNHE